jgi:hypothetical protein
VDVGGGGNNVLLVESLISSDTLFGTFSYQKTSSPWRPPTSLNAVSTTINHYKRLLLYQ